MTLPGESAEVTVIGGGIVGAACSLFLARRGLDVVLLESEFLASGSSGACEGNLLLWDKELGRELPLAIRSHELWAQLDCELGASFEFDRKGSVVVAETPDEMAAVRARVQALAKAGLRGEVLDEGDLRREEPALAPGLAGGALFPDDAQLEPRLATTALARAARRAGARLCLGTRVERLITNGAGRATAVVTSAERLASDAVVIAAGVRSPALTAQLGFTLPIGPRKGVILVTERTELRFARKMSEASYIGAVESDAESLQVAMVVESTPSGTVLIGSSRERQGFDRVVDPLVAAAIADRAIRFFPALAKVRMLRAYAGLRPFCDDHLPVIGRVPGTENVYVATGHEGAGISLAPGTAELIADCVCEGQSSGLAAAFSPGRFHAVADAGQRSEALT